MKREHLRYLRYLRWAVGVVGLVLLVVSYVARTAEHHEGLGQNLLTAGIACLVVIIVIRYAERPKV